jgi:adenosylcobinamide-phosphate synthase
VRGITADAGLHKSPNAGWPEAAISRALGIALAGPRSYDGVQRDFPWVNATGRRALTPQDIDETINMLWKAWGALFVLCAITGFATA